MSDRRAHRCGGCGAALPPPDDEARSLTCRFCGLTTELPDRPAPVVVRWDLDATTRQLGRKVKLVLIVGLLAAAAVVAWTVLRAVRPITEALDSMSEQARRLEATQKPIPIETLATIEPGTRWIIDAPAPPGGWATFDAVARLDWARGLARRWAGDARLERLEAGPIAPNGTVDLSGGVESSVRYRFLSPARMASWKAEADLKPNVEADYALSFDLIGGTVMAIVQRGRPLYEVVPPDEDLLSVADLLARARAKPGFPDRPFYSGHVTYLEPEGWLWSLQTLSGTDRVPMVRARTGDLFP